MNIDKITTFIKDILWYFEGEEEEEYEMNQPLIGMKDLFRGYIIKVWKGANFRSNLYADLNKTVI